MNILEGFTQDDDLVEFVCTKCGYRLWVPQFIVQELEEDNIKVEITPKMYIFKKC